MVLYDHLGSSDFNVSLLGELPRYLISINAQGFSLHVAFEVVVGHADAELDVSVHVHDAAVGIVLSVDLPSEYLVGGDGGDHVRGSTVDSDIVTGAELKGASHVPDDKEGVLYPCQGCGCVMGEPEEGWVYKI